MARASAVILLLVLALAAHAQARDILQAAKPAPAKECKPVITKPKKALCLSQFVRTKPADPKSAAVVTPSSIGEIIAAADAACAIITPGTFAVPESIKFGTAVVDCFNGKTNTKGVAFTEVGCCPAGSSLASWRQTRANGGQIDGGFARIRSDSYTGPQINGDFARARDTAAESGGSIGSSEFFGH